MPALRLVARRILLEAHAGSVAREILRRMGIDDTGSDSEVEPRAGAYLEITQNT